ncbi:MAG: gas vesicle protein [Dehalococcoidia bacterium]|nr:gas vesicle protein [Dehalococcoidia bacterium]
MALKMTDLAERARQQLAEITGLKPVAVVGSYRDAEGWHITVDMLEMARLPESTDILGTYLVSLDEEGDLLEFEKKRSRLRSESYEEEGG